MAIKPTFFVLMLSRRKPIYSYQPGIFVSNWELLNVDCRGMFSRTINRVLEPTLSIVLDRKNAFREKRSSCMENGLNAFRAIGMASKQGNKHAQRCSHKMSTCVFLVHVCTTWANLHSGILWVISMLKLKLFWGCAVNTYLMLALNARKKCSSAKAMSTGMQNAQEIEYGIVQRLIAGIIKRIITVLDYHLQIVGTQKFMQMNAKTLDLKTKTINDITAYATRN